MEVVHINTSDSGSGGAIAASRLHYGLLKKGVDSRLLVGSAKTTDDEVTTIPRHSPNKLAFQLSWRLGLNYLHITDTFGLKNHPWIQDAQVLNFHNLHGGYFNYLAIPKITQDTPAVWTLHDMWSFTGHCVYSFDCDRWKHGCGDCPYPETYPAIQKDTTRLTLKLKDWIYSHSNLVIVTLSKWLTEQAQNSILNRFPIHHIPNGIDTDVYCPLDVELCRKVLGLPLDKKILMFGAQSLNDSRKGGDLLFQTLRDLPESLKKEVILLTIGASSENLIKELGIQSMNLGYVEGDRLKVIAYSAADLFVFPTRADNLPLVLQESMACATPVVSFNVGGVPDLIRPEVTGYLAQPENVNDLRNGITELLDNPQKRLIMAQNARAIILKEYGLDLQSQRYINLYAQIQK